MRGFEYFIGLFHSFFIFNGCSVHQEPVGFYAFGFGEGAGEGEISHKLIV